MGIIYIKHVNVNLCYAIRKKGEQFHVLYCIDRTDVALQ